MKRLQPDTLTEQRIKYHLTKANDQHEAAQLYQRVGWTRDERQANEARLAHLLAVAWMQEEWDA